MIDFKVGDRVTVAKGASYRTAAGNAYEVGRSGPARVVGDPDDQGDLLVRFDAGGLEAVSPEFLTLIENASGPTNSAEKIAAACDQIKELLLEKNRAYGDSALNPVRVFSKADAVEQIKVRIDDKISRLQRGKDTDKVPEDTVNDLIGYLILLKIAEGAE